MPPQDDDDIHEARGEHEQEDKSRVLRLRNLGLHDPIPDHGRGDPLIKDCAHDRRYQSLPRERIVLEGSGPEDVEDYPRTDDGALSQAWGPLTNLGLSLMS